MTEIRICMRAEHDRRSPTVSIRVSLSSLVARQAQSPQLIVDGLGQGPLLPDCDALHYRFDRCLINVESSVDVSLARGKPHMLGAMSLPSTTLTESVADKPSRREAQRQYSGSISTPHTIRTRAVDLALRVKRAAIRISMSSVSASPSE